MKVHCRLILNLLKIFIEIKKNDRDSFDMGGFGSMFGGMFGFGNQQEEIRKVLKIAVEQPVIFFNLRETW